jgi:N6-adenosine-specific RNA methylase IME4
MPLDAIKALPVGSLAAKDRALFLWLPRPWIFEAKAIVEAWGFVGKSIAFVWVKPRKDRQADLFNPERDFPFGNGYGTRANAEICLLATRGKPKRRNADVYDVIEVPGIDDVIEEPRSGHSRKPFEIHERIERLFCGRYIELSRARRCGWAGPIGATRSATRRHGASKANAANPACRLGRSE